MTTLKLFNTLTNALEPFEPLEANKVRMYVCGPTVYDAAHLGHARCYIVWDVLNRFLRFLGYDVTYVRNVTDVDDKILAKARATGKSPEQVAEENYASFQADMAALNVLAPDKEPKATAFIAQMIGAIETLIAKGAAYATSDGTVYYRVSAKADYGKLSKKPLDDLRAGARVEVDPHKESPLDFALWKHVSPEEQSLPGHAFDSPWGKGRPGWHIECSAMNFAELGRQIDIHAGGADLIFPHHENEIAQSEAWLDLPGDTPSHGFAKYWLHNGFVNVSGEKMSKSLGNFSTIQKVLERYDANTIRYFLLTNKYRMPVDFNDEALEAAEKATQRLLKQLRNACADMRLEGSKAVLAWLQAEKAQHQEKSLLFESAMLEDLNTAKALALLNESVSSAVVAKESNVREADLFLALLTFCTLGFSVEAIFQKADVADSLIAELTGLVEGRKQAKAQKNWGEADSIRDRIVGEGYKLLDNKDGTTSLEKDGQEILRV